MISSPLWHVQNPEPGISAFSMPTESAKWICRWERRVSELENKYKPLLAPIFVCLSGVAVLGVARQNEEDVSRPEGRDGNLELQSSLAGRDAKPSFIFGGREPVFLQGQVESPRGPTWDDNACGPSPKALFLPHADTVAQCDSMLLSYIYPDESNPSTDRKSWGRWGDRRSRATLPTA